MKTLTQPKGEPITLPPLPKPFQFIGDGTANDDVPVFTAEQVREAQRAAIADRERLAVAAPVAWMTTGPNGIFSKSREMLAFCQGADLIPLYTHPAPVAVASEPVAREWKTPPVSWRLLAKAAINLLCAIDEKHDTKQPPMKYAIPYGAVNDLRKALGAATPSASEINDLASDNESMPATPAPAAALLGVPAEAGEVKP